MGNGGIDSHSEGKAAETIPNQSADGQSLVRFDDYAADPRSHYDEMFAAAGDVRPLYRALVHRMAELTPSEFQARQRTVDLLLRNQGVTFTVYSDDAGIEKVFPFDPIPRLISADEWERIERGLVQRTEALNLFLRDIYGEQKISPTASSTLELITGRVFRREMTGWCRRAACTPTSSARTSCGTRTAPFSCSKTTCAIRAGSATCSSVGRR
jgi:hypothetical protein